MKSLQDLLREADPLRHESNYPSCERERRRREILEASLATGLSSRSRSRLRSRLLIFAAVASILIVASFFTSHVQAAVRFEVRLAEDKPAPGLRQFNRAGSAPVYVHQEAVVTNSDIASAQVLRGDAHGEYAVGIEFNRSGAEKIRQATASHIDKPLAIIIDGQVVAVPVLRSPIGASAVVDGNFTKADAERIVNGVRLRLR